MRPPQHTWVNRATPEVLGIAVVFGIAMVCSLLVAGPGVASPARRWVSVGPQARWTESMSVADVRPGTRGAVGGQAGIGIHLTGNRWLVAEGFLGGSRLDFAGAGASGSITDFAWSSTLWLEFRGVESHNTSLFYRFGVEYGNNQSRLRAPGSSTEGPETQSLGLAAGLGLDGKLFGRLSAYGDIAESVGRSHVRRNSAGTQFDWLGLSFRSEFGLRIACGD